jgi:N-acetylglutamate synthase-like GNAT family acetyltransferase
MTAPLFQARRATLDDLPALRPLWEAERLDAVALEKRLTEFQVVCDETHRVVGAIAMLRHQQQGLVHSEVFEDFALADTLRPLLWERLRTVGRNHALARMWTRETSQFWRVLGFDPPDEEQLAKFPAAFGEADTGPLLTLKVRDDPFADMTPEQEEAMLKQHLRADTEKMLQQARTLRMFAYAASVVFIIVLAICGYYLLRYKNRQNQSPADPYRRRRF